MEKWIKERGRERKRKRKRMKLSWRFTLIHLHIMSVFQVSSSVVLEDSTCILPNAGSKLIHVECDTAGEWVVDRSSRGINWSAPVALPLAVLSQGRWNSTTLPLPSPAPPWATKLSWLTSVSLGSLVTCLSNSFAWFNSQTPQQLIQLVQYACHTCWHGYTHSLLFCVNFSSLNSQMSFSPFHFITSVCDLLLNELLET